MLYFKIIFIDFNKFYNVFIFVYIYEHSWGEGVELVNNREIIELSDHEMYMYVLLVRIATLLVSN